MVEVTARLQRGRGDGHADRAARGDYGNGARGQGWCNRCRGGAPKARATMARPRLRRGGDGTGRATAARAATGRGEGGELLDRPGPHGSPVFPTFNAVFTRPRHTSQ